MMTLPRSILGPYERDDRDRSFRQISRREMCLLFWGRVPLRYWGELFAFLVIGLQYAMAGILPWLGSAPYVVSLAVSVFLIALYVVMLDRRRYLYRRFRHGPLAAMLVAYRRCGACAYDLRGVNPDAEGFIACPECGAAWHTSRVTRADQDAREDRLMKSMIRSSRTPRRESLDHRAMPLPSPFRWPPRWLTDTATPKRVRSALNAAARKQKRLYRWIAIPMFSLGMITGSFFLTWLYDDRVYIPHLPLLIIAFLVLVVVYTIFGRLWVRSAMRYLASDRFNACNHCGQALPDTPPEFDGCRVCAICGAAWKAGTHLSLVVEPATA